MADAHDGFRERIANVFERWAEQLQALLWEMRPQLRDGADTRALARFIIASLEGGMLLTRVTRDIATLESVAEDLKRHIAANMRAEAAA
jgi:hypothetical protein